MHKTKRKTFPSPLGSRLAVQRGGAVVELAVVLPLLLVMMMGLVDLGRAGFEAVEVADAAHAGATYGARSKALATDEAGIRSAALSDLENADGEAKVGTESERYCECYDGSAIDCEVTCDDGQLPLMYVRVRVERQFQSLFGYPGVPKTIDIGREAHLRIR